MLAAAGLLLGLAGSLHCVAMCGPLAMLAGRGRVRLAAYHGPRIAVYAALGFLAGGTGELIGEAGLQRLLAVGVGASLVTWAMAGLVGRLRPARQGPLAAAIVGILASVRRSWPASGTSSTVLLGLINGLLPCGLVYGALAAAAGLGRASAGALFMAGFGLGAVPALVTVAVTTARLTARARARLRFAAPMAMALVGLLLIARGSGVDIAAGHRHDPAPEPAAAVTAARSSRATEAPAGRPSHRDHPNDVPSPAR